jgi:hypothetical protein
MSGSVEGSGGSDSPPPCFVIVRRGAMDTFRVLKDQLEEPNVVEVIWDRRIRERRAANRAHVPDRRRGERRGLPPEVWSTFGFVIAAQTSAPPTG